MTSSKSSMQTLTEKVCANFGLKLRQSIKLDISKNYRMPPCFRQHVGRITVFAIKVALATICAGKLVDKLRCESKHTLKK
jgi:hypothetical protein